MDTDDSLGDIIGDEYLNKEDVTDINNIDNISNLTEVVDLDKPGTSFQASSVPSTTIRESVTAEEESVQIDPSSLDQLENNFQKTRILCPVSKYSSEKGRLALSTEKGMAKIWINREGPGEPRETVEQEVPQAEEPKLDIVPINFDLKFLDSGWDTKENVAEVTVGQPCELQISETKIQSADLVFVLRRSKFPQVSTLRSGSVPQIQPGDQENIIFNVEGTEHLAAKVKITNANKVFITFNNISSFPSDAEKQLGVTGRRGRQQELLVYQVWSIFDGHKLTYNEPPSKISVKVMKEVKSKKRKLSIENPIKVAPKRSTTSHGSSESNIKNVTGNDDLADILRQGLPTLLQKGNSSMSKDDTERIVDLCIRLSKPIRNHPSSLRSKPLPPPNRESVLSTSFRLLTPTTN